MCKSWLQASIEAYYKELTLKSAGMNFLKSELFLKAEDQGYQQFGHGRWNVKLEIFDGFTDGNPLEKK
jgi:hypothetical protein